MESLERAGGDSTQHVFLPDDLSPTIAEHATQCQSLFHQYIEMPGIVPDPDIIDDRRVRFVLWASDMHVYGPLNKSLDYKLRFSPRAAHCIHHLLDDICDTLLSLKPINAPPRQIWGGKRRRIPGHDGLEVVGRADDDPSDSESGIDAARRANIEKITGTIAGTVKRLVQFSFALRDGTWGREMERHRDDQDANEAVEELRLSTKRYIESRFPKAPEALRSALIRANASRLGRLYHQRAHRRRIDASIRSPGTTTAFVGLPEVTKSAPAVRFGPSPAVVANEMPATSILGDSKLSFSPMPPPQPQCPYCGCIVECRSISTLLWQNHVIEDLEPFVCVFSSCLEDHDDRLLTFETPKAWLSHLQIGHRDTWKCMDPPHDPMVFDKEIEFQEHIISEHGVSRERAPAISKAERTPVLDKILECPFGDDFQPSGKAEPSAVFSSQALEAHVVDHMKDIALLALQHFPVDDDDVSARVAALDLEDKEDSGMTKLHRAVQTRHLGLIESLLQGGASANLGDENGQTPLHYAMETGFIECTDLLVQHGADLQAIDRAGFPPLVWAVVAGQEGAVTWLLAREADANSFSADGKSALGWAASLGWSPIAEMLLGHGASVSDSRNAPLDEAAASGNLATVGLLLQRGADPNHVVDHRGWSAIHWAAEEGHLEIVRVLLKAGANPNAASLSGTSPLHCAANGGHLSIVKLLLAQGAEPVKSTCHGWTALHHAAFMGHSHVVQGLLEDDGIRSTALQQDNHGWSVLHLAVHSRDAATVRSLLDSAVIAAPRTLVDQGDLTAEEWLDFGPTSHLHKAISGMAFSKSRCCRAVTGLRQAALMGNVPMIKLLCRLGHDVNGMNSGRRTALYCAAKKHMLPIMDVLLDLGADPNILPAGWKSWGECISSGDVLLRLNRAGYRKRDADLEVERQIRRAFHAASSTSTHQTNDRKRKAR